MKILGQKGRMGVAEMDYKGLILEEEGHIATVTLNRPEVGNALGDQLNEEIDTVIRALDKDNNIRAVIITGAGKYFCTGVDLTRFGLASICGGFGQGTALVVEREEYWRGHCAFLTERELGVNR